jgi:di/tricarboxylate transporter
MTFEIGFLFALLLVMAYLFFTERVPVDLTAFLALVVLILSGYLDAGEAFSGFSSPAVITMLGMFIVSGALDQTGVADALGGRIHAAVGSREVPLMIVVMLATAAVSAFMFNVAAAAVMMPAVGSIAARAGLSPSRLFMPLSFGAVLGGTVTLVGTPPNIVASEMLQRRGLEPFSLFDFTPIGLVLVAAGVIYMSTLGRKLLPVRERSSGAADARDLAQVYQLQERLFSIRLPRDSRLDGMTLGAARIGSTLNVQVIAILRNGRKKLAPHAEEILRGGDVLLVEGRLPDLQQLVRVQGVEVQATRLGELPRPAPGVSGVRMRVASGSLVIGKTLKELQFRQRFGVVVVGIKRGEEMVRGHLGREALNQGDEILALGTRESLDTLKRSSDFDVQVLGLSAVKQLHEHVFLIRVPDHSPLVGTTVASGRIGELVGLTVGGIIREGETRLAVSGDEVIRAGDRFLVAGEPEGILRLLELGDVHLDSESPKAEIESDEVGVVETALAPRSSLLGRTLGEIRFRERYGLQVLAIWREARPIRTGLAEIPLRFGDALLLQGSRDRITRLALDPDFLVLSRIAGAPKRTRRASVALGGLVLMIGMVVFGFQPIHVAAFTAAALVVLFGALTTEEMYRAIELRTIFRVAAVLPVGIAMERTGAALVLADAITGTAGSLGPYGVLASLVILSSILSQILDGAPAVVLVTPVAMQAAADLGLSAYPLMMGVALGASAAFMTPFGNKAALLVMGAGGYRTKDFVRVGTPLTLIVLLALVLLVPIFFPFH